MGGLLPAPQLSAALLRQTDPQVLDYFATKVMTRPVKRSTDMLTEGFIPQDLFDSIGMRNNALALAIALNDNCSPETFTKLKEYLWPSPDYKVFLSAAADWTKDQKLDLLKLKQDEMFLHNKHPDNEPVRAMIALGT